MIVKVNAALDAARGRWVARWISLRRHAEQLPALFNGADCTRILATVRPMAALHIRLRVSRNYRPDKRSAIQ